MLLLQTVRCEYGETCHAVVPPCLPGNICLPQAQCSGKFVSLETNAHENKENIKST